MSEIIVTLAGEGAGVEWLERVEAIVTGDAGSDARCRFITGCAR